MPRPLKSVALVAAMAFSASAMLSSPAQENSVNPGINDSFKSPDATSFVEKFEVESREVFLRRKEIVAACRIGAGETVADIGAGTGLFTRLFSNEVGAKGRVIAVDIAQNFLDHIEKTSRELGQRNVETLLCRQDSTNLPPESVDVAFICDTYHHFEFPMRTMASLHRALKPGGRLILIDFHRQEGKSSDWVMTHVRAGQEVFEAEIVQSGFKKTKGNSEILKENYLVVFQKPDGKEAIGKSEPAFPIISKHGGIRPRPSAVEQPRAGAKVVFDLTADSPSGEVNKGLDRVARLLNLYGAAGLAARDVAISVVVHGDATKSILDDEAYKTRHQTERNPNLPLLRDLRKAGVEVLVCGQALNRKGIPDEEVSEGVSIAASAMTALINKQADGFAYLPIP